MTELVCVPGHGILHSKFGPGNRRSGNVINNQGTLWAVEKKGSVVRRRLSSQIKLPSRFGCLRALLESQRAVTQLVVFFSFFFSPLFLASTYDSLWQTRNTIFAMYPIFFFFPGLNISFVKRAAEICNVNPPFCRGSVE